MALTELEEEDSVPVNAVAKLMRVESDFITKHSKELEQSGSCAENLTRDARYVLLSLTDIARKSLVRIARSSKSLSSSSFDYLSIQEFAN
ncbi:hypothetical protein [Bradyrhizobium yuanmingense]|uniref:hypothetical protein n=1 Tax=Bradyrhizobium yuanmingense TaxID=108015 RepID=UPI001F0AB3E3|nr:hypothetical protein [Bradyrhizobium yuanmingense]